MRLKFLIVIAIMVLALLSQHNRLLQVEAQLNILSDCCQTQGLKIQELEKVRQPEREEPMNVSEVIRKVTGYFDDHDVSGLLEDD